MNTLRGHRHGTGREHLGEKLGDLEEKQRHKAAGLAEAVGEVAQAEAGIVVDKTTK